MVCAHTETSFCNKIDDFHTILKQKERKDEQFRFNYNCAKKSQSHV